jgi:hypothetical protein
VLFNLMFMGIAMKALMQSALLAILETKPRSKKQVYHRFIACIRWPVK